MDFEDRPQFMQNLPVIAGLGGRRGSKKILAAKSLPQSQDLPNQRHNNLMLAKRSDECQTSRLEIRFLRQPQMREHIIQKKLFIFQG